MLSTKAAGRNLPPLLLVLALCTGGASGQVVLEEQVRRVEAEAWVYDDTEDGTELLGSATGSAEAPDFRPFERVLNVEVDAYPDPFGNISHGTASQFSTVSATRFHGSGGVDVYAESDEGTSRGFGLSQYFVRFTADQPQQYHLGTKMFSSDWVGHGFLGYVRLSRADPDVPATVVFEEGVHPHNEFPPPAWDVERTGVLPAGTYEFDFFTRQRTDIGSGYDYEFEFTLANVPEPAAAAAALVLAPAALLRRSRRRR